MQLCLKKKKWICYNSYKAFGSLKREASILFTGDSILVLEIEAEMYRDWWVQTYLWHETGTRQDSSSC